MGRYGSRGLEVKRHRESRNASPVDPARQATSHTTALFFRTAIHHGFPRRMNLTPNAFTGTALRLSVPAGEQEGGSRADGRLRSVVASVPMGPVDISLLVS